MRNRSCATVSGRVRHSALWRTNSRESAANLWRRTLFVYAPQTLDFCLGGTTPDSSYWHRSSTHWDSNSAKMSRTTDLAFCRFLWQMLLLDIGSGTRLNSVSQETSCSPALQWLHFGTRTTLSSVSWSWPLQSGRPHKPKADWDFTIVTGSRGVRQKSNRGMLTCIAPVGHPTTQSGGRRQPLAKPPPPPAICRQGLPLRAQSP
mmetsp:Transcript_70910/g.229561  ORF Transcript_70910/g.229561 Transcript_70910/m.229561 type:complete len:204 (-) Transcript_70910:2-613(-)